MMMAIQNMTTTVHPDLVIDDPLRSKIIGACLAIFGNMFISVAMNVQKHAHNQLAISGKFYLTDCTWWCGMALMAIGELGNFSAYGFAPASLVAPLGSSGVIINSFIAVIFLKEKIRLRDVIGIVWAILGGYLIVNFSQSKAHLLDAQQVVFYLRQYAFIIYVIIEINILLFIVYLHHYKNYRTAVTILLQVALLGSFTVIAAKALSSMLRITFRGTKQLVYPMFYVMLAIMAVSIVGQIKYLNEAMAAFDATVVMPINFILFTISAILSGIVFYREFYQLTFMQVALSLFGATLSFLGVYLICGGRESKEDSENENTGLLNGESPIATNESEIQMKDVSDTEPGIVSDSK